MTELGSDSSLQTPPTAPMAVAAAQAAAVPAPSGATDPPSLTGTVPPQKQKKGHLEAVVRGGSLNMFGAIVNSALSVALVVVIARGFTPAVAGSFWSLSSLFLVLQQTGKLGIDTGVVYFLPRHRVQKRMGDLRYILRLSLRSVLVTGFVIGLLLFILAPQIADVVLGQHSGSDVLLIRVLAVGMPMSMVYDILMAGTRGFGSMAPGVFLNQIGRAFLQPILVLVLLALNIHSVIALGIVWLIPYLPTFPIAVAWLRSMVRKEAQAIRAADAAAAADGRGSKGQTPEGSAPNGRRLDGMSRPAALRALAGGRAAHNRRTPPKVLRREFWNYNLPRALASGFQIALTRLDIVLVSAMRGPAQAAVYVAVTRLVVLGQTAVQAVQSAMQPQISALLANDERSAVEQLYQVATAWLVMLSWPIYLIFATYGGPVLEILGRHYSKAGSDVVTVLAIGMLFAAASGPVDVLLLMAGQSRRSLFNRFVALVVNVGIDLALIPHMGILGASIGWAVALVAANVLGIVQVHNVLGFTPFGAGTRRVVVMGLVFFAGIPIAVRLLIGTSLVGFFISGVLASAGYGLFIFRHRQLLKLRLLRSLRVRRGPRRAAASSAAAA